jgi:hypothetical protein
MGNIKKRYRGIKFPDIEHNVQCIRQNETGDISHIVCREVLPSWPRDVYLGIMPECHCPENQRVRAVLP